MPGLDVLWGHRQFRVSGWRRCSAHRDEHPLLPPVDEIEAGAGGGCTISSISWRILKLYTRAYLRDTWF